MQLLAVEKLEYQNPRGLQVSGGGAEGKVGESERK